MNVSGLPASRWPRWRSARPGPHKGGGAERHLPAKGFQNTDQLSGHRPLTARRHQKAGACRAGRTRIRRPRPWRRRHTCGAAAPRRCAPSRPPAPPPLCMHFELRVGLERHETHRWACGRLGDCFGVAVVVLLRLDVWAHVFWRPQSNRVSLLDEGAAHVVRTAARLHRYDTSRQLRAEGEHRLAPHAFAHHHWPARIQPDEDDAGKKPRGSR